MSQDVEEKTEEQKQAEQAARDARYALENKRNRALNRMSLLIEGIGKTTDTKEQGVLAGMLHREYQHVSDIATQLNDRDSYYENRVRLFGDD